MYEALSVFHHAPGILSLSWTTALFALSISPEPMGKFAAFAPI